VKREDTVNTVRQDVVTPELRPPCPGCGCRAVFVVDETASSFYFTCVQCDRTWQQPRWADHN
jgi:hypothetical protein